MSRALRLLLIFSAFGTIHCEDEATGEQDVDEETNGEEDDISPWEEVDEEENILSHDSFHKLHGKADQDSDGKLSLEELMEFSRSMGKAVAVDDTSRLFGMIDVSNDGTVSLDEYLRAMVHPGQRSGGDDLSTMSELDLKELEKRKSVGKVKFNMADHDEDGELDKIELQSLLYPDHDDGVVTVLVGELVHQRDANADGKLNVAELFMTRAEDVSDAQKDDFAELDVDGDGLLNAHELRRHESGRNTKEKVMKEIFGVVDKDEDRHITEDEWRDASQEITTGNFKYHVASWAEHSSEL